jgi:hypothetical protein
VLIPLFFSAKTSFGAYIGLKWTANSEADLDGYNIYYATSSGNYGGHLDVGNVTEYELSGLTEGTTYSIALTAYDFYGNESRKSNEVIGIAKSHISSSSITSTSSSTTTTVYGTGIIIEAEEMSYHANGAQQGEFWNLWANGVMSEQVYFSYTDVYHFVISAKGSIAYGVGPEMGLIIDGVIKRTVIVNSETPAIYLFNVALAKGTHEFAIGFHNDFYESSTGIDRNLYVDKTMITHLSTNNTTTTSLSATTSSATTTTPLTTTTTPSDNTSFSGSISINNGDEVTYSTNVVLTLFATDGSKELDESAMMIISNDNENWSDPEFYKTTKMWILLSDPGEKTVYVKFRDAAGNWMGNAVNDRITYEELEACNEPYKLQPVSVTASSEFFSKSNVIDGNPLTVWSTFPSFFWKNEFITLDLGETKQINGFNMYASNMFGIDYLPTNFQIQISSDNINWKEVASEKGYDIQSTHDDRWDFNTPEAQYIRVYVTKAKTFFIFHLVQIAEIEVYGCDISEQKLRSTDYKDSNKVIKKTRNAPKEKIEESYQGTPSVPGKPIVTFE